MLKLWPGLLAYMLSRLVRQDFEILIYSCTTRASIANRDCCKWQIESGMRLRSSELNQH